MKAILILWITLFSFAFCDTFDGVPNAYQKAYFQNIVPYADDGKRGSKIRMEQRWREIRNLLDTINKKNKQKFSNVKLNTIDFNYEITSVGVDKNGYVCGRIVISKSLTDDIIAIYDYKSLIEGTTKLGEPIEMLAKRKGSSKEEKIILVPMGYDRDDPVYLLVIKSINFNDILKCQKSSFSRSYYSSESKVPNVEEALKIRKDGHAYLPKEITPEEDSYFKK